MNAVVEAKAGSMELEILGKVLSSTYYDGTRYTVVTCPNPDPYGSPATVEIRSTKQIGAIGEAVKVRCRLGGFRGRPFQSVDKETGEVKVHRRVSMTLDAVE